MATISIRRNDGTAIIATSTGVEHAEAGATVPFGLGLIDEDECCLLPA